MKNPDRPNILLIIMDATRADHLSCYGYSRRTTPNIDRIARKGVRFKQAISVAPWTVPTHASMFTGLYPSEHRIEWTGLRLTQDYPTLAQRLNDQGYETLLISANTLVSEGLNKGFGKKVDLMHPLKNDWPMVNLLNRLYCRFFHQRMYDKSAWLITRKLVKWFRQRDTSRPFFAFVNYLEPHSPYILPSKFRHQFSPNESNVSLPPEVDPWNYMAGVVDLTPESRRTLTDLYDAAIRYTDHQIGRLITALRDVTQLDKTCVIITADHGENLGDHNLMDHHYSLHETLIHVPLIIRYPNASPRGIDDWRLVQTTDLYPTILAVAGQNGGNTSGLNLLDKSETRPFAVAEYLVPNFTVFEQRGLRHKVEHLNRGLLAIRNEKFKYIWASDGQHELHDLCSDPKEKENLMGRSAYVQVQQDLHTKAVQWLEERLGDLGKSTVATPDHLIEERLRALGYID